MDLKVQVGTRTPACAPHLPDLLPLKNLFTLSDKDPALVGIKAAGAVAMSDFNEVAVATITPASKRNPAVLDGYDGCASAVSDIDALVHASPAPAVARRQETSCRHKPALVSVGLNL